MLKTLSLIFIRLAPLFLVISLFGRSLLYYNILTLEIVELIDLFVKVCITIGLIILSFTFKFCTCYRLLLYSILLWCIIYTINLIYKINIYIVSLFGIFIGIFIILLIIFLYTYLKDRV